MAEQTCPRCSGSGQTEQSDYEQVTDPDGTIRVLEKHRQANCSYCSGSGRVAG